ncbi:hypothetical protein [Cupriavidus taiwanensis]|uniref:hypothetical protein n=1 Tax=Cupriavidus taiwanensis TaxID=164546 RepID=UPI000E20481B|nr:hypothetical protein [Cupriavidus taiwanensis]
MLALFIAFAQKCTHEILLLRSAGYLKVLPMLTMSTAWSVISYELVADTLHAAGIWIVVMYAQLFYAQMTHSMKERAKRKKSIAAAIDKFFENKDKQ